MREDTESTQKCVCACVLEEVIESFLKGQCHAESLRSMVKEGKRAFQAKEQRGKKQHDEFGDLQVV